MSEVHYKYTFTKTLIDAFQKRVDENQTVVGGTDTNTMNAFRKVNVAEYGGTIATWIGLLHH